MAESVAKNSAQAKLSATGVDFPATYWLTVTNIDEGTTWIVVPSAGTLWVFYEWGNQPAQQIYVWHQGGSTTPINGGENTVTVGEGDALVYQLANPGTDAIKLAYQMQ